MNSTVASIVGGNLSTPASTLGPPPLMCVRQYVMQNKTKKHYIYSGYSGIPENLVINIIVWLILILVFTVVRKLAWNYARLALLLRHEKHAAIYKPAGEGHTGRSDSQESLGTQVYQRDQSLYGWVISTFILSYSTIRQKCGTDAVAYLTLQRYILTYSLIVTLLCLIIVLPVNMHGGLIPETGSFGRTTIGNIVGSSALIWVHVIITLIILVLGFLAMYRYLAVHFPRGEGTKLNKTILITSVPADKCTKESITQHFRDAYGVTVHDVNFAYDVKSLTTIYEQRVRAHESFREAERAQTEKEQRITARPYPCGFFCHCCERCGCPEVDAVEYFKAEERRLAEEYDREREISLQNPLNIVFVTLAYKAMATRVVHDFNPPRKHCRVGYTPSMSAGAQSMEVPSWNVDYAPAAGDIFWPSLSTKPWVWWVRALLINAVLFVILLFFTTPAVIMNVLDEINYKKTVQALTSPFVTGILPVFLLLLFSTLLPTIVFLTENFVGHWTRTASNYTAMVKAYIFLLLMLLVLPSIGLTSAKAFFEWVTNTDPNAKFRWSCIFLPDNGAFFVNYVISATFIGSGMQLLRVADLLLYSVKIFMAKSNAEKKSIRKIAADDFPYGRNYAWMLCVFAMILVYSVICPLITPFGLVYLAFKYMVDKYNLYFAFRPTYVRKKVHVTAVKFVYSAIILLQCNIVLFTTIRADTMQPPAIVAIIILVWTLAPLVIGTSMKTWRYLYRRFAENPDEVDATEAGQQEERLTTDDQRYVPPVLRDDQPFRIPEVAVSAEPTGDAFA